MSKRLLDQLLSGSGDDIGSRWEPITSTDNFVSFQPIKDLKIGDMVKYKKNQCTTQIPNKDQIVQVYSVFDQIYDSSNSNLIRKDFSIIVKDDDDTYLEIMLESRRFEKVKI